MFSKILSVFQPAPVQQAAFVPLSQLPAGMAASWHRCPPLSLSDAGYDRLYDFLQANLEGRWSLMIQDRNHLDRYDVLLEIETEAGLLDLFRTTIGMQADEMEEA